MNDDLLLHSFNNVSYASCIFINSSLMVFELFLSG